MIYINRESSIVRTKEIEQALDFIRKNGKTIEDGKVELDGKNLYINFMTYESKERSACKYEAHENYIDVQYVIEGEEAMPVTTRENMSEKAPYDPVKDVTFYNDDKEGTFCVMKAGDYVVVFPDDVHMPKVMVNGPTRVKKAVAKIKI